MESYAMFLNWKFNIATMSLFHIDPNIQHNPSHGPTELSYKASSAYFKIYPKKLDSICCTQCRETKADTLKATEANRRRGPGTREKVT
jgi:hypothetical protein